MLGKDVFIDYVAQKLIEIARLIQELAKLIDELFHIREFLDNIRARLMGKGLEERESDREEHAIEL